MSENVVSNRYEFAMLFDVENGNPNGNPDAENRPRIDFETGLGQVSDVCIKRKIRNYIQRIKNFDFGYDIFIREQTVLNDALDNAYEQPEVKASNPKDKIKVANAYMRKRYYDVRTFGAVMTTGTNSCGQVHGPAWLSVMANSIDRVEVQEHCITRNCVTNAKDSEKQSGVNQTMGRKFSIPYGLYFMKGGIDASWAKKSGFTESDLELFWEALKNMFDLDRSASRGIMSLCGLYVFKHDSELGNCPAKELFDRISVVKNEGVEVPRKFSDYSVTVNEENLPSGIEFIKMV